MSGNKDSLVTIIMRTKDRPVLLKRALRSVAMQTFNDYTLVVVNDNGDESVVKSLINEQQADFQERILLINTGGNTTREGVLAFGLEAHHAPFFAIHDDDDSWEPEFLEKTTAFMREHPDYAGVSTRTDVIFEEVNGEQIREIDRKILATDKRSISLLDSAIENYCPTISQLIRRDIADQIGHWRTNFPVQADWDFNIRVLASKPIGFIDALLSHWHQRESANGSMANSVFSEQNEHRDINRQIREEYLRADLNENAKYPGLGLLLAEAYYHRETMENITLLREQIASVQQSLYHEIKETARQVQLLHQQLDGLRNQISQLAQITENNRPLYRRALDRHRRMKG